MIRTELISFSFKSYLVEKEIHAHEDVFRLYSENVHRDEFEDFAATQVNSFADRLVDDGKYFELVSVTSQVISTPADVVYVFSLEFEDEDIFEDE